MDNKNQEGILAGVEFINDTVIEKYIHIEEENIKRHIFETAIVYDPQNQVLAPLNKISKTTHTSRTSK